MLNPPYKPPPQRVIPKSVLAVFGQDHAHKTGKRSAERRIVQPMSAHRRQVYAVCVTHLLPRLRVAFQQRARLSALTLAALATGYYPDGSAPEPGFPRRPLTGVSPVSPTKRKRNAAVKHAPCGPVFVPVDRGPEAARERMAKSARGHRTSPFAVCGMPSGTAPCTKRGDLAHNRNGD